MDVDNCEQTKQNEAGKEKKSESSKPRWNFYLRFVWPREQIQTNCALSVLHRQWKVFPFQAAAVNHFYIPTILLFSITNGTETLSTLLQKERGGERKKEGIYFATIRDNKRSISAERNFTSNVPRRCIREGEKEATNRAREFRFTERNEGRISRDGSRLELLSTLKLVGMMIEPWLTGQIKLKARRESGTDNRALPGDLTNHFWFLSLLISKPAGFLFFSLFSRGLNLLTLEIGSRRKDKHTRFACGKSDQNTRSRERKYWKKRTTRPASIVFL